MTFGARARIRLGAIRSNLEIISSAVPGARLMAVIKANAYGHGLVPVAKALTGVDALAVARLSEAKALRAAGVTTRVVLLGGILSPEDIDSALNLRLDLGVHDEQQIRWIEAVGKRLPVVWLKLDTGMHRLGIAPERLPDAIKRLEACCDSLCLMTHFANADATGDPTTRDQVDRFLAATRGFEGPVSVANSPALLGWPETLDTLERFREAGRLWIRPGLSLFGISPFPDRQGADIGLEAAMRFEARLISVKRLQEGAAVGYGGTWIAERDTTLGIIAAGYGDGYSRCIPSGTPVLVNGRRVPVAGRISMDLTAVDLGEEAADRVGDPVTLWGDGLPVEEIAEHANTIPYQLVTGVTHREAPVYYD